MGRQAWIHGISQARGPKRKKKRKTGKKKNTQTHSREQGKNWGGSWSKHYQLISNYQQKGWWSNGTRTKAKVIRQIKQIWRPKILSGQGNRYNWKNILQTIWETDITIKGGLRSRLDKQTILKDGLITGKTESIEEKLPSIETLKFHLTGITGRKLDPESVCTFFIKIVYNNKINKFIQMIIIQCFVSFFVSFLSKCHIYCRSISVVENTKLKQLTASLPGISKSSRSFNTKKNCKCYFNIKKRC